MCCLMMKNTLTYIDDEQHGLVTDYLGETAEFYTPSGIHMEPTDYTFSMSAEYIKYLLGVQTYEK